MGVSEEKSISGKKQEGKKITKGEEKKNFK